MTVSKIAVIDASFIIKTHISVIDCIAITANKKLIVNLIAIRLTLFGKMT